MKPNLLLSILFFLKIHQENKTPFYPAYTHCVNRDDLEKILTGNISNEDSVKKADRRVSNYFIVSNPILNEYDLEEQSRVLAQIPNAIEMLDSSAWFGKFTTYGQSEIIVPNRFDLRVNPFKKQVYLEEDSAARYYGSGNLQYDKDCFTKVLKTDLDFEDLREIVKKTCSKYQHAGTLNIWN